MVLPSISFRNPVVHLDKNTIRFFNNYTEASVYTVNGRVGVRLRPGKFQLSQLAGFLAEEVAGSDLQAWRMQPRLEVRHQRHAFQMGAAHCHREETRGSISRQLVFESSHGR